MREMKTVVVIIGNSDNKLGQASWAHLCESVGSICRQCAFMIHFSGGSDWSAPWQNACWVVELESQSVNAFKEIVSDCGKKWDHDSVAFLVGDTEFI